MNENSRLRENSNNKKVDFGVKRKTLERWKEDTEVLTQSKAGGEQARGNMGGATFSGGIRREGNRRPMMEIGEGSFWIIMYFRGRDRQIRTSSTILCWGSGGYTEDNCVLSPQN